MLHNGELGQDLCIVHFNHALVNLAPSVTDPGNVKQHGAVFPERPSLDVVDEPNGRKVHVGLPVVVHNDRLGDVPGLWRAADGALGGHGVCVVDGPGELR